MKALVGGALAAFLVLGAGAPGAHAGPGGGERALDVLAGLSVAVEHVEGYARSDYPHWTSNGLGSGCDTRDAVLSGESRTPVRVRAGCYLDGGVWVSVYDGVRTRDPSTFDVDHLVPLYEAHRSGAWRWDTERRTAYANDLGFAGSLVAVSAASNRAKSDADPSDWLPRASQRCAYAGTWVAVKYRWSLSVDTDERAALARVLRACGNPALRVPAKAPAHPGTGAAPVAPSPVTVPAEGASDPRFSTCAQAIGAGFGPYVRGVDAEYAWYRDSDGDGRVCET